MKVNYFIRCVLFLFLTACAPKRVAVQEPLSSYHRPTWVALELTEGHFRILAKDEAAQEQAMKELCQTRKYICMGPEVIGKVIEFERRRK